MSSGDKKYYHTVWLMLFLGWFVSYVDRSLTSPVVTWMIENKVAFFKGAANPHALGGLIGGLFFAGYMLMQFPAGYIGDKHGHKAVVVISILWAGLTTLLTGIAATLFLFVAIRVLTGVGEGTFYSNDRTLIAASTPPAKRGLGMGLVISGLCIGMTVAFVSGSYTLNWASSLWGINTAWKVPFLIWGIPTIIVGCLIHRYIKDVPPARYEQTHEVKSDYGKAFQGLSGYAAVFIVLVMLIYYLATKAGLSDIGTAAVETILAFGLIVYIYARKSKEVKPVIRDLNLVLVYISAVAILWSLWFYGFWAIAIIRDTAKTGFMVAALNAAFFGLAGIVGFPLGGKLSDWTLARGNGRKVTLMLLTAAHAALILLLGVYVIQGGNQPLLMGGLLFISGLFFFALQPVSHALTADLAPVHLRASAFGMWNLIAEIGAVLSPVVSGAIRDATGTWGSAILLDGALVAASLICLVFVKEAISPAAQRTSAASSSAA